MTDTTLNSAGTTSIFVEDKLAISIAIILITASGIAWLASYYLLPFMMTSGGQMEGMPAATIVSALSLSSVSFFVAVWVVGMIAMMFPAMIPIVLFYDKVKTRLETNRISAKFLGIPLFLGGYLVTYALLGVVAYLAIYGAIALSSSLPVGVTAAGIAPSAILIATGVYQFSPLKNKFLFQCVSPIGFFATHANKGVLGAFKMGFSHGSYCVGCCWAYMLVMFAVGAMSIPVMAVLAGLIALEKVIVRGSSWFNRAIAVAFISLGVVVFFIPTILLSI
jgi:predicted metal-binding membrane protein